MRPDRGDGFSPGDSASVISFCKYEHLLVAHLTIPRYEFTSVVANFPREAESLEKSLGHEPPPLLVFFHSAAYMSRRAAGGRGSKAKAAVPKDDLARAAAEVLNGITAIAPPPLPTAAEALLAQPSKPSNVRESGTGEVDPRTAQQVAIQPAVAAAAAIAPPLQQPLQVPGTTSRGFLPGSAAKPARSQQHVVTLPPDHLHDTAAGVTSASPTDNQLQHPTARVNGGSPTAQNQDAPHTSPDQQEQQQHKAQQQQQQHQEPDKASDAGPSAPPTLLRRPGGFQLQEIDEEEDPQHQGRAPPDGANPHHPEDTQATGSAAKLLSAAKDAAATTWRRVRAFVAAASGPNTALHSRQSAAAVAAVILLFLALALGGGGYRTATSVRQLAGDVAVRLSDVERQLAAASRRHEALAVAVVAGAAEHARSGAAAQREVLQRLAALEGGLAEVRQAVAEAAGGLAEVRAAAEREERLAAAPPWLAPPPSLRSNASDPARRNATAASNSVSSTTSAGGGTAEGDDAGVPSLGGELRNLPPCHARRMAAAAGPVLRAHATSHSPVAARTPTQRLLLRTHTLLSSIFGSSKGPCVHPLARLVPHPGPAPPACLPLALPAAAAGDNGSNVTVEFQLDPPAALAAVSLRYPSYGTWDTRSSLTAASLTLHEGPPLSQPTCAGTAATSSSHMTPRQESSRGRVSGPLIARHVDLGTLQGMECQWRAVPEPEGGTGQAGGAGAQRQGQVVVHRVTLHLRGGSEEAGYVCVPRVLLHGVA